MGYTWGTVVCVASQVWSSIQSWWFRLVDDILGLEGESRTNASLVDLWELSICLKAVVGEPVGVGRSENINIS